MEVTQHNFFRILPLIKDTITWSNFLALDIEFTGLGPGRVSQLDTPEDRYLQARATAEDFPPCQIGLACFGRDTNEVGVEEWQVVVVSIYVCQRAVFGGGRKRYPVIDRIWKVQASSVEFLRRNEFDLGKWLHEGVDWIREDDEKVVREMLDEDVHVKKVGKKRNKEFTKEDRKFLHGVESKIRKWFKGKDLQLLMEEADTRQHRAMVFDMVEEKFPTLSVERRDYGKEDKCIVLEKFPTAREARRRSADARENEKKDFIERKMKKHIGVRAIFDEIRESKKPVLMHNCLLDLSKIVANFVAPLPATLTGFKTLVRSNFPTLCDTKHISNVLASRIPWFNKALHSSSGTSLIEQFLVMKNEPHLAQLQVSQFPILDSPDPGMYMEYAEDQRMNQKEQEKGKDSKNAHNAGYDALTTGRFFLQLAEIMKLGHAPKFYSEPLFSMVNKISLSGCGGYNYLDLSPGSREVNRFSGRDDVFVIDGITPDPKHGRLDHSRYDKVIKHLLDGTEFKFEKRIIDEGCILLVLNASELVPKKEEPVFLGKVNAATNDLLNRNSTEIESRSSEAEPVCPEVVVTDLTNDDDSQSDQRDVIVSVEAPENIWAQRAKKAAAANEGKKDITKKTVMDWLIKVHENAVREGVSIEKYVHALARGPESRRRSEYSWRKRRRVV